MSKNLFIRSKFAKQSATTDWNSDSAPSFGKVLNYMEGCHLAFTVETAYFGDLENKVSTDKLIKTGRAFYKALMEYLKHA